MQRRKFLIGAGGTVIGASALIGSGAFSNVQANRDITVSVADDASAYLGLTPSDGADAYVSVDDGTISLDFDRLNRSATTMFIDLFTITNDGTRTVGIQIDRPDLPAVPGEHMHFFVGVQGGGTLSAYDRDQMADELDYDSPGDDPRVLEPGDELPVGLYFVNQGAEWDEETEFTINALDQETAEHVAE